MPRVRKYPPELLDRGARLVFESGRPIAHVARDLGVPSETLRRHVRQIEADEGRRPDLPTAAEREEIKQLRKEVYELRRANDPQGRVGVFRDRARCRPTEVSRFIDDPRWSAGAPMVRRRGVLAARKLMGGVAQRRASSRSVTIRLGRTGTFHAVERDG